ncbi:MAG: ATP-binding protein [Haloarculaceae archaeon]
MNVTTPHSEAVLDALPMQLAVLDEEGDVLYTNRAWRQFGVDNDRQPPADEANYIAVCSAAADAGDEDAAAVAEGLRAVSAGERDLFVHEYPCHSPDRRRWFTMRAAPFTAGGDRYVLVVHLDITERRLTEEAVRERNDQLDALASVLAHDLRNPLSVALGYAELLAEDDTEHAAEIVDALDRMDAILDDALTLARQSAPDGVEPVDLAAAAREAWATVETGDAMLAVEGELAFLAAPGLLAQLFENLFRNAVVHAGPSVHVAVGALDDGFYVADDGPGIPVEDRDAVFEAGYTTGRGTGFGLSIVERVAAVHDWTVAVTESEDGGARFEVTGVTVQAAD